MPPISLFAFSSLVAHGNCSGHKINVEKQKNPGTMSCSTYFYRAAFYLNNTGVALLEKQCYRQAMETLCDAISVMKDTVLQAEHKSRIQDPLMSPEDIEQKLHKAARRLSNPISSSASMVNDFVIKVISDDESALVVASSFDSRVDIIRDCCRPSLARRITIIHLVRMEPHEQQEVSNHAVEAAICLYNFGQAYKCLSKLESSTPYASSLLAGSHQLTHLALALLSSSQSLDKDGRLLNGDRSPRNLTYNRAILMTAMSLQHLLEFASAQEQFHYYEQRLQSILPFLYTLRSIEGECKNASAGAA